MAELSKVNTAYILKWEGGLSKNKADTASKDCVPDGSGYHTNKGITWAAWKSVFGSDIKGFYEMKPEKWLQVYKRYWAMVEGDLIKSQRIAELFADWAWASGKYSKTEMQNWLNHLGANIKIDGDIGKETLGALNGFIVSKSEKWMFESAYAWRCEWIKKLRQYPTFGKGWMRRMNDFYLIFSKQN